MDAARTQTIVDAPAALAGPAAGASSNVRSEQRGVSNTVGAALPKTMKKKDVRYAGLAEDYATYVMKDQKDMAELWTNDSYCDDDLLDMAVQALICVCAVGVKTRDRDYNLINQTMMHFLAERGSINWDAARQAILDWARSGYQKDPPKNVYFTMEGVQRDRVTTQDQFYSGRTPAERKAAATIIDAQKSTKPSKAVLKLYERASTHIDRFMKDIKLSSDMEPLQSIQEELGSIDGPLIPIDDLCHFLTQLTLSKIQSLQGHTPDKQQDVIIATLREWQKKGSYPAGWSKSVEDAAAKHADAISRDPFLARQAETWQEILGPYLFPEEHPQDVQAPQTFEPADDDVRMLDFETDEEEDGSIDLETDDEEDDDALHTFTKLTDEGRVASVRQDRVLYQGMQCEISAVEKKSHYEAYILRYHNEVKKARVWHIVGAKTAGVDVEDYLGTQGSVKIRGDGVQRKEDEIDGQASIETKGTKTMLKSIAWSDLIFIGVAYRPEEQGWEYNAKPQQMLKVRHRKTLAYTWYSYSVLKARYGESKVQGTIDEMCKKAGDLSLAARLFKAKSKIRAPLNNSNRLRRSARLAASESVAIAPGVNESVAMASPGANDSDFKELLIALGKNSTETKNRMDRLEAMLERLMTSRG